MKKLLTLLFSILISFNSYGEWTFHAESSSGEKYYIDSETIRKDSGYVYFWELQEKKIRNNSGNKGLAAYYQGDCGIFRLKRWTIISYSKSMGTGVSEEFNYEPDWLSAPPGSIRESSLNLVCNYPL